MLSPRAVEVWSYLIGLGRVGQPVVAPNAQICADLRIRLPNQVSQLIAHLIRDGAIQRDDIGVYTVLRRIGNEATPCKREPRFMTGRKHFERRARTLSQAHRVAKLSEIPDDTRDLTARLFGDPLPGRSALDRKRGWTPEQFDGSGMGEPA